MKTTASRNRDTPLDLAAPLEVRGRASRVLLVTRSVGSRGVRQHFFREPAPKLECRLLQRYEESSRGRRRGNKDSAESRKQNKQRRLKKRLFFRGVPDLPPDVLSPGRRRLSLEKWVTVLARRFSLFVFLCFSFTRTFPRIGASERCRNVRWLCFRSGKMGPSSAGMLF